MNRFDINKFTEQHGIAECKKERFVLRMWICYNKNMVEVLWRNNKKVK